MKYPNFIIFRHNENRKWFSVVMDIDYSKIGLNKQGIVDILNVKLTDSGFRSILLGSDGYFEGYHMNKDNWLTILLDGTVVFEQICKLIDNSFEEKNWGKQKI